MILPIKHSSFSYLLTFFIFIIVFWGIKYSSDWEGYVYFYTNSEEAPDFAFGILSSFFNHYGLEYYHLYKFHIIIIAFSFCFFISRFVENYLFIVLVFLLLYYVVLGNQIRYYVALPLGLIAVYYLYVRENRMVALVFTVLALLNHSSIGLFFVCFFLFAFSYKYMRRYSLMLIVFINAFILFAFEFLKRRISGHFGAYFDNELQSSVLGGIFTLSQYVVIFLFLYWVINLLKRINSSLLSDRNFIFLYILSFCTTYLLFPSITTQILANRYISPLMIVWLIFLFYIKKHEPSLYVKKMCNISIVSIILIRIVYVYILPFVLFGKNDYVLELFVMFNFYEL